MFEDITGLFFGLITANPLIGGALVIVSIFIVYKLFQYVTRAAFVGVGFAILPIILNFAGFNIAISIENIIWFAIAGIAFFFIYSAIRTSYKILDIVFAPFTKLRKRKKRKVIVIEKHIKHHKDDEKD